MKEIKGDLLELAFSGKFDIICHGCNCQKTMGAGIAAQIKYHYKAAYTVDVKDKRQPLDRLGNWTVAKVKTKVIKPLFIYNLYTQFVPGNDFMLSALDLALFKLNIHINELEQQEGKKYSIAFPQIGAGIGGGNWEDIKKVIGNRLGMKDVTIVYYDKKK